MTRFLTRPLYSLLLWLLLPYIFFHLLWRALRQPEYLSHIAERFGFYTVRSDKPLIWLHAVSVGETRAAASLVKRLQEEYPDHQLLLTGATPTGRAAAEQLYGDEVLKAYLPYDYPFAVGRFLDHFRPRVGILLETEIWFSLIHECHAQNVPLLLINARLSEKSARGYARYPALVGQGLRQLATVSAQTGGDARRLTSLGANNVSVMGNLKFDITPPPAMLERGQQLRAQWGADRKIFLAASTREGEEALLLDALAGLQVPHLLTVIVPRHPQRFDEVADLLTRRGIRFQRRSENRPVAVDTAVLLGNSMGELFAYYEACDLAFIGGSLLPLGGQNLIEAAACGKPVLVGPHTFNFTQVSELATASGAARRVQDAAELMRTAQTLLLHPEQLAEMGEAGLRFVSANRGATGKALSYIAQFMANNSGKIMPP